MAAKTKKRKPAPKRKSRTFGSGEPGSGERFAACVRAMSQRPDIDDPAALCATIGRRKYGKRAFQRMAAAGKRRNPSEEAAAAELSEQFHGRPVETLTDLASRQVERFALAELGRLAELVVILPSGQARKLSFASRRPRVCASPDGGQLYFEGGDQALDLAELGLADALPKDHVEIGHADSITYHTSKAFHNFEPSDYRHRFGDEGGELPTLGYDVLNQWLYLIGGTYQVRPEGIVN